MKEEEIVDTTPASERNKKLTWEEFLYWNSNSFGQVIPDPEDFDNLYLRPDSPEYARALADARQRKKYRLYEEWLRTYGSQR